MFGRRNVVSCAICAAAGLVASAVDARAQTALGPTRTTLRKSDYPGDKPVCIQMLVEYPANAVVPRHTHPGIEAGYVIAGSVAISEQDQPDRALQAGDSYQFPYESPHGGRVGPGGVRIIANFVVDPNKPLLTLAPA